MTSTQEKCLDWRDVATLLTSDAGGRNNSKKLRIRALDTIFLDVSDGKAGQPPPLHPARRSSNPYARSSQQGSASGRLGSLRLPNIAEWIYTSKKGELTRRGGGTMESKSNSNSSSKSSSWTHVCDRFIRIALSDTSNSSGPRIVAVGRGGIHGGGSSSAGSTSLDGNSSDLYSPCSSQSYDVKCHITAEQFKRDVGGNGVGAASGSLGNLLSKCRAIQCYVRPRGGRDCIFRSVYSLERGGGCSSPRVDVMVVEDGSTVGTSCASVVPLDDDAPLSLRSIGGGSNGMQDLTQVKKEAQMTTIDIVTHVESVLRGLNGSAAQSPTVTSVAMDFVLDDRRQLWLSHAERMIFDSTDSLPQSQLSTTKLLHPTSTSRSDEDSTIIPIADGGDVAGGGGVRMHPVAMPPKQVGSTVESDEFNSKALTSTELDFVERNCLEFPVNNSTASANNSAIEKEKERAQEEAKVLRDRVRELEEGVQKIKARLEASNHAALDATNKVQELNLKVAKLRKQTSRELQEKDEQHAQIVLDLESQINASRAEVARLEAAAVQSGRASRSIGANSNGKASNGSGNYASESLERDLLAKIDSLHHELTSAHRNWGQERRALASTHAGAEQERAAKHRRELAEQRAVLSSLEDDVVAQKEKTREAEKEKIVLLQKLAAANHRSEVARDESLNLRDELDLIKQSLDATRASAISGCCGDGGDNDAAVPPPNKAGAIGGYQQASTESRIRTLNNKVEYLKAQLQSEVTVKEEYMSTITDQRKEKETIVDAHRHRMDGLEAQKEEQIGRIQEQLRQALERPSEDDVVQLQEEAKALQLQLEEARKEAAEARRKEQVAKAELVKEQSLIKTTKQELESARNEHAAASKEIDRLKEANLDVAANEGMLRRLDNERRYLKNQLHLEIAAKTELMKQLEESEQQLRVAKDAGKQETRSLSIELKKEKHSRDLIESQLRDSSQVLEAEVEVQKSQIEELRQAYATTRDQLRVEQASAEQIRAAGQRMAEELKAAQDELKYLRSVADDAAARHNETTRVISDSIKKADDIRIQEVCRLQEETQRALQQASDTQRDMLTLRASMRLEQTRAAKFFAAHHVAVFFAQRLRCEKQRAFLSWRLHSSTAQAKLMASEGLSNAIEVAVADARDDCNTSWHERFEQAQQESAARTKEIETKWVQERVRLHDKAKMDQDQAVRHERDRFESIMREKEMSWAKKEQDIHAMHQSAMSKLAQENNGKLDMVQAKAQKRIDAAASEAETSLKERQQIIIKDCNKRWEAKLISVKSDIDREKEESVAKAAQEHERILKQQRNEFDAREAELEVERQCAIEQAVATETERMEQEMVEAIRQNDVSWKARIKQAKELHAAEQETLKHQHEEELNRTVLELESARREQETNLKADLERRHRLSKKESLEQEQERIDEAVALEAQQWEQKMRQLQVEMEAKCRLQFDMGQAERDLRANKEMEEIQSASQDALAKEREDADAKLKQALNEKANELECTVLQAKTEKDEAVAKALQDANIEHERQLQESEQQSKVILEREQHRLSVLAEQETERAVATAAAQHEAATKALRAKLDASERLRSKDKEAFADQIEHIKAHAEDAMKKRLNELERRSKEQQILELEKAQLDFDRQRSEWNRAHKVELEKVESDALVKSNAAISKVQDDAKEAMKASLEKLTTIHKERERAMKLEIQSAIDQRDSALEDITVLQSNIANQQSAIEQVQRDLESWKKLSTLRVLRLATSSMIKQSAHDKALDAKQEDFTSKLRSTKDEAARKLQLLEEKLANIETTVKSYQTQRKLVHDVLVNHNRDALLRQKAKSREVSSQLEAIGSERQILQDKRHNAEQQREEMEGKIRELEAKIQQHSQTSSIQGGRVNIAHARKKRRLDEEYEDLLDRLESNREDILAIDDKLKDVMEHKEAADDRMKSMERTLVEILVEQQKKLLKIINQKIGE